MANTDYERGYNDAYAEIYAAIDSDDHPANCGTCRACGLMRTVLGESLMTLGRKLSQDDFWALAAIIKRAKQ